MQARVITGSDEVLDLQAPARMVVLVVSVPNVRGGVRCVSQRRGVLSASEDVAFGQGFVELSKKELCRLRWQGGNQAREGIVSASVVLSHDRLAHSAGSGASVVDHGGNQRTAHDAAGDKSG